jgi:hypothetical protein
MYATHLPDPWVIAELERLRRERHEDERPRLELPLPNHPARDVPEQSDAPSVIVIELW